MEVVDKVAHRRSLVMENLYEENSYKIRRYVGVVGGVGIHEQYRQLCAFDRPPVNVNGHTSPTDQMLTPIASVGSSRERAQNNWKPYLIYAISVSWRIVL